MIRRPAERKLYGEYLTNAQGEDVVAGIRTPQADRRDGDGSSQGATEQFEQIARKLEKHYRDVQDMEFTIERGKLYMLQTRSGKRTAEAAVKIAVDMVRERLITKREAVLRVEPGRLISSFIRASIRRRKRTCSQRASPRHRAPRTARRSSTPTAPRRWRRKARRSILVRIETNPDDVHGMIAAEGVLTSRGGRTSHAAVVARGMGKPCVAGAKSRRRSI